jgi:hypothetical protein
MWSARPPALVAAQVHRTEHHRHGNAMAAKFPRAERNKPAVLAAFDAEGAPRSSARPFAWWCGFGFDGPMLAYPFGGDIVGDVGDIVWAVDGSGVDELDVGGYFHLHDAPPQLAGKPVIVQIAAGRLTPMAMRSSTRKLTRLLVHSVSPNWLTPIVNPIRVQANTAWLVSKTMPVPAEMKVLTTTGTPKIDSTCPVDGSGDST